MLLKLRTFLVIAFVLTTLSAHGAPDAINESVSAAETPFRCADAPYFFPVVARPGYYIGWDYRDPAAVPKDKTIHTGLDLWLNAGESVYAVADGTVTDVGGTNISIQHENGKVQTYTTHLQKITKQKGDRVTGGSTVVGYQDNSNGHVHISFGTYGYSDFYITNTIDPSRLLGADFDYDRVRNIYGTKITDLCAKGSVTGKVLNLFGQPMTSATVRLLDAAPMTRSTKSDNSGTYSFRSLIAGGIHLSATSLLGDSGAQDATIQTGKQTVTNITVVSVVCFGALKQGQAANAAANAAPTCGGGGGTPTPTPKPGTCDPAQGVILKTDTGKCAAFAVGEYKNLADYGLTGALTGIQDQNGKWHATLFMDPNLTNTPAYFDKDTNFGTNDWWRNARSLRVELNNTCTATPSLSVSVDGKHATSSNPWFISNAVLTASGTGGCGALSITVNQDGTGDKSYTGPVTITDGKHSIVITVRDSAGHSASKTVDTWVDTVPPETRGVKARGPRDSNGLWRDTVSIEQFDVFDATSGWAFEECSYDGGKTWQRATGATPACQITGNGLTVPIVRATDNAGNVETPKSTGLLTIHKYTILNAGPTCLNIAANTTPHITGPIYTNCYHINDNTQGYIHGPITVTGGGNSQSGNTGVQIDPTQGGSAVQMLQYPIAMYNQMATKVLPVVNGKCTIDDTAGANGTTMDGIFFCDGDLYIYATGLTGKATFIASGNVFDQSTAVNWSTADGKNGLTVYAGKSITVTTTGSVGLGLLYAPNGTVSINGATNLVWHGSLEGLAVNVSYGTTVSLDYSAAIADTVVSLPLVKAAA